MNRWMKPIGALLSLVIAACSQNSTPGVPGAPASLNASLNPSPLSVALNWAAVGGATSYAIERSTDGTNFSSITPNPAPTATSYTDSNVAGGLTYTYRVRATNANGSGVPSPIASVKTPGTLQPPAAPPNFAVGSPTSSSLTLTWTPPAGATGYELSRSTDGSNFAAVSPAPTGTPYTDSGLTLNTRYYYRLVATNSAGKSNPASANGTTSATSLADPASVTASKAMPTIVTVTWSAVSGATSYLVERKTGAGTYTQITEATGLRFADLTVGNPNSYTYRVKAKNASATSPGRESGAVTPDAPCVGSPNSPDSKGCFGNVLAWPLVPTQIGVLPDGRLMGYFGIDQSGQTARGNYKDIAFHSKSVTALWDPSKGPGSGIGPDQYDGAAFQKIMNNHTDLFCSGLVTGPDGRLYTAGGNLGQSANYSNPGLKNTDIFDPVSGGWSPGPDMADGRWYPSMITLSSGELLIIGGNSFTDGGDASGNGAIPDTPNVKPEVWNTATGNIRALTSATTDAASATFKYAGGASASGDYWHYYPWLFQDPNKDKQAFMAGSAFAVGFLDTTANNNTGAWVNVQKRQYPGGNLGGQPGLDLWRNYGSAVMYQPGKIIAMGGGYGSPGGETSVYINLSAGDNYTPAAGPSMAYKRTHLMATLLPDGQVFVNGGSTDGINYDITNAVYESELISPGAAFRRAAVSQKPRIYHSASVLLPDGTVFTGGGGGCGDGCDTYDPYTARDPAHPLPVNQYNAEIYYPPYLLNPDGSLATRPVITAAPGNVSYGQSMNIQTDQPASSISRVTFIRLGSATHAFNMGQVFDDLTPSISRSGNTVTVTAPANGKLAPPGYYMLFVINGNGVPSAAKMVKIG